MESLTFYASTLFHSTSWIDRLVVKIRWTVENIFWGEFSRKLPGSSPTCDEIWIFRKVSYLIISWYELIDKVCANRSNGWNVIVWGYFSMKNVRLITWMKFGTFLMVSHCALLELKRLASCQWKSVEWFESYWRIYLCENFPVATREWEFKHFWDLEHILCIHIVPFVEVDQLWYW
jgi:hypothetical protein